MQNNEAINKASSFPLSFGKEGMSYQIDKIEFEGQVANRLKSLGFVKNAIIHIFAIHKQGIIVKVLESKYALGFDVAKKIHVKEYKKEEIETL